MKKVVAAVIVVVVLAAGVAYFVMNKRSDSAAVNSSKGTDSSSEMASMPDKSQNSSPAAPQATDKVSIADFAFSPANITVKKGTTVTWTNQDGAAHTVTETDGQDGPKSGNLEKGQSYSFTFNTAGTFKYDCSIHPNMTGSVTVTE